MHSALYAVKNLALVKNAKNDMLKMDGVAVGITFNVFFYDTSWTDNRMSQYLSRLYIHIELLLFLSLYVDKHPFRHCIVR